MSRPRPAVPRTLLPRSPLPAQLRDAPCRRAAPGLFDPLPSAQSLPDREARADRTRGIEYAARYCNGTSTRPECPYKAVCLVWALESRERVVAGGVEVTLAMIARYHKAKREEAERAAQETESPAHGTGELAERRRETGRRQPPRAEAEGAA